MLKEKVDIIAPIGAQIGIMGKNVSSKRRDSKVKRCKL